MLDVKKHMRVYVPGQLICNQGCLRSSCRTYIQKRPRRKPRSPDFSGASGGIRTPDPRLRRSTVVIFLLILSHLSTMYNTFLHTLGKLSTFDLLFILLLGYVLRCKVFDSHVKFQCIFMRRACIYINCLCCINKITTLLEFLNYSKLVLHSI